MRIGLLSAILFFTAHLSAQAPLRLRTDLLLPQPGKTGADVTISNSAPWLSWEPGISFQKADRFHLIVASSKENLDNNKGDIWDKTNINATAIRYAGSKLISGHEYYWKVQRIKAGAAGSYSPPAHFRMDDRYTDTISHHPLTTQWEKPFIIIPTKTNKSFFDFGKESFAQIRLHLDCKKTDTILLEAGEMARNNEIDPNPGRNIRYIKIKLGVGQGVHDYVVNWPVDEKRNTRHPIQMPEEIGEVYPFRYVSLTGDINWQNSYIQRRTVYYPFDTTASSFISDDMVLNKIWDLCKYSMKATSFLGLYVDGDRERIPYEADALINQLSHYAVDAEYSIARRTLAYLIYHPTWPTEWSLQDVLIAWNDYQYTGDPSFLEKYYGELTKKTLMPLAGNNGLISTKTGKQTDELLNSVHRTDFDGRHTFVDIVDWPQTGTVGEEKQNAGETDGFVFNTYNAVVNAFYYRNLILMEKIAVVLHKPADAKFYRSQSQQVFNAYQKTFFTFNGLVRDGDSTQHCSLHANMFAMAFGLIPEINKAKVAAFIKSRKMACSVYGAQFLLDALYEAGEEEHAWQLMSATTQRSWYNMLRNNATITLEAWDKLYKPNLDMNHAWGAVPANIIVRKLMGVEPVEAGFNKIGIHPQPGSLQSAKLTTPTIRGAITVSFEKKADKEIYDIIVPATANICLPAKEPDSHLYLNGKLLTAKPANQCFNLPDMSAGSYHFEIRH